MVVLLLAFIVLATAAASRVYRRGARTDDLIDEEAEAAKYIGADFGRKRVSEQRLDVAGR